MVVTGDQLCLRIMLWLTPSIRPLDAPSGGLRVIAVSLSCSTGSNCPISRTKKRCTTASVCVRVKHVFAVVKHLTDFTKDCYRGLTKNAYHAFTALALATFTYSAGICWHGRAHSGRAADRKTRKRSDRANKSMLNVHFFRIWSQYRALATKNGDYSA